MRILKWIVGIMAAGAALVIVLPALVSRRGMAEWHPGM